MCDDSWRGSLFVSCAWRFVLRPTPLCAVFQSRSCAQLLSALRIDAQPTVHGVVAKSIFLLCTQVTSQRAESRLAHRSASEPARAERTLPFVSLLGLILSVIGPVHLRHFPCWVLRCVFGASLV